MTCHDNWQNNMEKPLIFQIFNIFVNIYYLKTFLVELLAIVQSPLWVLWKLIAGSPVRQCIAVKIQKIFYIICSLTPQPNSLTLQLPKICNQTIRHIFDLDEKHFSKIQKKKKKQDLYILMFECFQNDIKIITKLAIQKSSQ